MQRERIEAGGAPHDIEVFERDAGDATCGLGRRAFPVRKMIKRERRDRIAARLASS